MPNVVALARYPLKSAAGHALRSVGVGPDGLDGDRTWACLDAADGTVGSVKHPRRWSRLLDVTATLDPTDGGCVVCAGGHCAPAGSAAADALVSRHLGREVRLTRVMPDRPRLHRQVPDDPGLVPGWVPGASPGRELVTEMAAARPGGRFVDFGAVHLLTTGALDRLVDQLARPTLDPSRFRANVVLDLAADPDVGQELRLGDVVLRVVLPTPRCAVPGVTGGDGGIDRELLAVLARRHRRPVADLGEAACFGVYTEVLAPGRLEVGVPVR